jgi:chromosome segregation ATPase
MKALKQDAIQKVEKFISQLQSHEIIIDPKAQTITLKRTLDNRRINLSELLYEGIQHYQTMRDDARLQTTFAELCLQYIQRGYTYGIIKETTGLSKKLEVLEKTNTQLRNENETCKKKLARLSANYLTLQGRYEELNEKLNKAFKQKNGGGV